jgi:hypothetical protein
MTEEQAKFVKKLRIDHGCSSATVARKFYEKYGSTDYCDTPTGYIYFDVQSGSTKVHNIIKDGCFVEDTDKKVIENLFDSTCGDSLYRAAMSQLKEDIVDAGSYSDDLIQA